MSCSSRARQYLACLSAACAAVLLSMSLAVAAPPEEKQPEKQPAEKKPAEGPELLKPREPATKPSTNPAKPKIEIPDDVRSLLDEVRDAYKAVKSLKVAGTISSDIDVNSEQFKNQAEFTGAYAAPMKFRHQTREKSSAGELADGQRFGSTGKKLYAYEPRYSYVYLSDAPAERTKSSDLPEQMVGLVSQLNPSLLLAVVPDAAEELLDGATKVEKAKDLEIDSQACPAVKLTFGKEAEIVVAFDGKSKLVRRVIVDRKGYAIAKKQQDVKKVELTIDYASIEVGGDLKDVDFGFTPPVGARDVTSLADAGGGSADDAAGPGEANALLGKPAPEFQLKDLKGQEVKLSDLKGKVVMLDFWATWCGPCRASMPHLDAIYKEFQDQGLVAYAVNLREKETVIKPFVDKTSLLMPVLLDTDGKVAKKFGVSGIPQTVVIDKEGNVKKITVGSGTHEQIKAAIEEAIK